MARETTKYTGVYTRQSVSRRHGGKPDLCFDITYKDANGKKVWEKIGWRSEGVTGAYASRIRSRRVLELREGRVVAPRGLTLHDTWKAYDAAVLEASTPVKAAPWRRLWRLHVPQKLKSARLGAIRPEDLDELIADLSRNLAPQTVKHVLSLIGRIYNHAIKRRLWSGLNPLLAVTMPRVDNSRVRWLTQDEADALLSEVARRSLTTWRICLVSLHTGLRAGEIFALEGQDVLIDALRLTVRDPKGGVSRHAMLTQPAATALDEIDLEPGQLVFPNRFGARRSTISRAFARGVDALELNAGRQDRRQRVVFHTLRHTYASWLVQAGTPLPMVAALMGHATQVVTERYGHLCPDGMAAAIARVPALDVLHGR